MSRPSAPEREAIRLPPQSLEAEQAVLGALLIEPDAFVDTADLLAPTDFYREGHAAIYRAMQRLAARSEPIDIVTVANELEKAKAVEIAGGRAYLSVLPDYGERGHVRAYAEIVRRKAIMREYIDIAGQIAATAYAEDEHAEDKIEGLILSKRRPSRTLVPVASILPTLSSMDRGTGISTGIHGLDRLSGGLHPGDLTILAARPSVGKTSLALNIAEWAAVERSKAVGFFSLEMSADQLVRRILSSMSGVEVAAYAGSGWTTYSEVQKAATELADSALFIDDTPTATVWEIRSKARRLQAEAGLDLVIIDYLQLMNAAARSKDGNRVQEVSEISRGLKALARELKIPVIALSQLSRQPEQRDTKEPKLSDLRESGAIEQDADLVLFLWPDEHLVHAKLAKHRNGPTGAFDLRFHPQYTKFSDA